MYVITDSEVAKSLLPKRKRESHKGMYGRATIVAGSLEYSGAAYLAGAACLRSGVGYTTLFVPRGILPWYALKAPEMLLKASNDGDRYEFNEKSMQAILDSESIAFGMGMGVSEEVAKGAEYLLKCYEGKLLLDADGLNSLAAFRKEGFSVLFGNKKCDVVLTPHVKEFSRLSNIQVEDILFDPLTCAQTFAQKYAVTLLLKNACSIVTDGKSAALNVTGNSGQAKGGSGDVLSGVIAGLCATGLNSFDGARLGAYLVGKAAELGVENIGEYSLTASDLIAYLGRAFLSLMD